MNSTLFVTALRQRFTSTARLVLTAVVFLFPLGLCLIAHEVGLQAVRVGPMFAFILSVGILGQESSSGVLQLLFARPIRRWEYVVSRWLAVVVAACGLIVLQVSIACLLLARHGLPEGREIFAVLADQATQAIGTASVILFFSSFISGAGDVIAIVLTFLTAQVVTGIGQWRDNPVMARIGEETMRFVAPQLPIVVLMSGGRVPWFEVVSYVSTVSLCVAVAVVVVNRREISYASD